MRLIHTSDWHLGRTLHGADLLSAQAGFLDWLLAESVRQRADAVIVAGDVYDRAVPTTDAVTLLDRALSGFATAGIPVLLISGNHDSAIRLGFGARLSEAAGIHLRTSVADISRPVLLADEHGEIAMYGLPFLLPDAVMDELGADRSHASVLAAATDRIRADAAERGIARTIVTAHAFVSGAQPTESERDIRVGGVADAPASVFAGFSYVALGHLHGQQNVAAPAGAGGAGGAPGLGAGPRSGPRAGAGAAGIGGTGAIRYSGSPLAFSFSERRHAKSVTLAEIDGAGQVRVTQLATPVPRPLRQLTGKLDELLERDDPDLKDAWIKVVLTDPVRPAAPMEQLRERWPHTLVLDFAPDGELADPEADVRALPQLTDPVEICGRFVEFTSGGPPDDEQLAVLADVVEAAVRADTQDRGSVLAGAGGAGEWEDTEAA
jgi:exonuclease SbcD